LTNDSTFGTIESVQDTRKERMKQTSKAFTDSDFVIKAKEAPISEQTQGYIDVIKGIGAESREFPIEEVDIPRRSSAKKTLTYPIGTLKAGSNQSFFVPTTPDTAKAVTSSIRTLAYRNGFKVIIRQEKTDVVEGMRVWRKV
jgi:hypothetical protein